MRRWELRLFWLWACLVWGMFFVGLAAGWVPRLPVWARLASSVTLALVACLPGSLSRHRLQWITRATALGMLCGCVGDFLLAPVFPSTARLMTAMAAFSVGHIVYAVGWLGFSLAESKSSITRPFTLLSLAMICLATAGWKATVAAGGVANAAVAGGALFYAILLSLMTAAAMTAYVRERSLALAAVGALLFFASDGILSAQLFHPALFRSLPEGIRFDVVWLLYGTGQALIVGCSRRLPRAMVNRAQELSELHWGLFRSRGLT